MLITILYCFSSQGMPLTTRVDGKLLSGSGNAFPILEVMALCHLHLDLAQCQASRHSINICVWMNNYGPSCVLRSQSPWHEGTQLGHLWGKEAVWEGCKWFTAGRQRPQTPGQIHVKINIFMPQKKKKKKERKKEKERNAPNWTYIEGD